MFIMPWIPFIDQIVHPSGASRLRTRRERGESLFDNEQLY